LSGVRSVASWFTRLLLERTGALNGTRFCPPTETGLIFGGDRSWAGEQLQNKTRHQYETKEEKEMKNRKVKVHRNVGKGSQQEILPNRHTLAKLLRGDPSQRSLGRYAKAAPSGVDLDAPSIEEIGPRVIG